MIVVQLKGGLGNQMFQYAAGRALALRRGDPLLLDTRLFAFYPNRSYALGQLRIESEDAPLHINRLLARQCFGRYADSLLRKAETLLGSPPAVVRERMPFQHDQKLFADLPADVYLVGYWQNEGYFRTIADHIRHEFTLRALPDKVNAELLAAIEGCAAVSLHVRRGDYVSDKSVLAHHGVCSLDYYRRAITLMGERVAEPHFFVFSDDIPWAREHLDIPWPVTYLGHNGSEAAHEDLRLMRACKHHVIANSSFSWWGAWLSEHPDKTVIAPRPWLSDPQLREVDPVPAGWLKLESGG